MECNKAKRSSVILRANSGMVPDDDKDSLKGGSPISFSALANDVDVSIIWGNEDDDEDRRKAQDAQKKRLQERMEKERAIVAQLGAYSCELMCMLT
jgi:hypothetical protein